MIELNKVHLINMNSYHSYELRQLELEMNGDGLRDVGDGSDQLVVVGQEVVVESLCIRISALGTMMSQHQQEN